MKKFIFGCALMIAGMIGFSGCLLAQISLVQPGAWSGFFNVFSFDEIEAYIILAFFIVSIVGTVIAVQSLKEDKK